MIILQGSSALSWFLEYHNVPRSEEPPRNRGNYPIGGPKPFLSLKGLPFQARALNRKALISCFVSGLELVCADLRAAFATGLDWAQDAQYPLGGLEEKSIT